MASVPGSSFVAHSPLRALDMALAGLRRYKLSDQREDLDKAILHLTESILFPPHSWLEHGPIILQALFLLAFALFVRLRVSELPEDATHAVKYLRYLRDQPHRAFGIPRSQVTKCLVDVLSFQVKLEAGNVMQNIGEMAVLCRELLTLDMSDVKITQTITLFADTVMSKFRPWYPDHPFDQVIECLRAARKHKPDLHEARFALAHSLSCRYFMNSVNDDYEEAASIYDEFTTSSSSGDSQDVFVARAQESVTNLAIIRSRAQPTPEHSEEAIYRVRALLASPLVKSPGVGIVFGLEHLTEQRFSFFGSIEGLEVSSRNSPSLPDDYEGVDFVLLERLRGLRDVIRNDASDITKIDKAIEEGRSILASMTTDPFTSFHFCEFGEILDEAFQRTKKIDYLNESIGTLRHVLECSLPHFRRFSALIQLSLSLIKRSLLFPDHCTQDANQGFELFSQCVDEGHWTLPLRFRLASLRATFARLTEHPSVDTAYESAVSLMQGALLFAPTLELQHATLTTSDDSNMPLDHASYQVDLGRLEEAIQTLERGRALLWSEMRYFRTSIDQLLQADPDLGSKFEKINRDLEELTKSIPPSHQLNMDDDPAGDVRAVDPFGRLVLKQRSLLKERDKLILQIQALPDFDSFLAPPSFDTLRSAASSGPVIIINDSMWRSDILILLHNSPPSLITTPPNFYDRVHASKDKLFDSRDTHGLDSSNYEQTLASVLAELYELVGKPVIDRLRHLEVPEQSRIWWCPTSVFCSLPLHAMGPIPSDDGEKRYFLDLYICSYTPTLSALIQARNRDFGSRSLDRPSLLLVAQPDPSLPTVGGEIQVVRGLDTEVTSLISEAATPAAVIDGFHHHQFVHFACHGTLEAGKAFKAGFGLHGERLTLLEIVRSHLPSAEFAFLSACHTAEVTQGSIADEGLHLAAAVQYCGFRSVVGTMWAMFDEDGQYLAKQFYKALFSRREQDVQYHERSAEALQFAVKKLRGKKGGKKRMTLERWVNFVHYGA